MEGLDNLIKRKLLSDKKMSKESLIPWKPAILKRIYEKISKLKTRKKPSKLNLILKHTDVINCLEALQKKFVLAPIDKLSNNVVLHVNSIILM